MLFKRYIIAFIRHIVCFHFLSTSIFINLIYFLLNIGKQMSLPGFRSDLSLFIVELCVENATLYTKVAKLS